MVRPGFYLGRAYINRAFILNFTLYNEEVAEAQKATLPRRRRRRRGLLAGGRADLRRGRLARRAMRARDRSGSLRWLLLGLLRRRSRPALTTQVPAPVLAVDPDEPGPSLPPVGRSLFDFLTMQEEGGRTVQVVPFPFTALLEQIEAELGRARAVAAGGPDPARPLAAAQRRQPRLLRLPARGGRGRPGPALRPDRPACCSPDRLYLGYQEKAATIEVISYNEAAGRFEYQVVRDYREGGAAEVYYADRPTCIACHRNHAPIFSKPLWDETNANAAIAATLAALQDDFYGIPVARGVDIPDAFDAATDRANSFAALQRIWQEGCELPAPADAIACRADALLAVLQYRLAGNRHPAPGRDGPGEAFAAALARSGTRSGRAASRCRTATCPIACRSPQPLDPHVPLSEADAIRLTTIERAFEPFEPRPPREIWHAPETTEDVRRLVQVSRNSSPMRTSSGSTRCCGNRTRRPGTSTPHARSAASTCRTNAGRSASTVPARKV